LELGAVGARELWLEPERDRRSSQVNSVCSCGAAPQHSVANKATLHCNATFPLVELRYNAT
jgi:hypothetical protein